MGEATKKQTQPHKTRPHLGIFNAISDHPNFKMAERYWAIIGTFLGVFGVYAYYASIKEPNLTYYISPTRTAIVQKGHLDDFSVTFLGKQVEGDLSSAEIQLWNKGKAPILGADINNGGNIESPVRISTANSYPIYQVTTITTREQIAFNWEYVTNPPPDTEEIAMGIQKENTGIKLRVCGTIHG
jgi:hypothetical protein